MTTHYEERQFVLEKEIRIRRPQASLRGQIPSQQVANALLDSNPQIWCLKGRKMLSDEYEFKGMS